jgi:hypothetical protein
LTEVDVDGARAWVRTSDLDEIESTRPRKGAVNLVGGFDPLIVGGGLREQLLPSPHVKRISRTAGWISPVVLIDGRAAGVWDSRVTAKALALTIDLFEDADADLRKRIGTAAQTIGRAHGLGVTVGYGRAFHLPPKRRLVISPGNA